MSEYFRLGERALCASRRWGWSWDASLRSPSTTNSSGEILWNSNDISHVHIYIYIIHIYIYTHYICIYIYILYIYMNIYVYYIHIYIYIIIYIHILYIYIYIYICTHGLTCFIGFHPHTPISDFVGWSPFSRQIDLYPKNSLDSSGVWPTTTSILVRFRMEKPRVHL